MRSSNRRNRRIKNLVERRSRRNAQNPALKRQAELLAILDALNCIGALEDLQRALPETILCFGPLAISGVSPAPWSSVVIWHKPAAYRRYQNLSLLGIWALDSEKDPDIIVGTRTLKYRPAFFNAESYFFHLRRDFRVHYGTITRPPNERESLFSAQYSSRLRIDIRRHIEATLTSWRNAQRP